MRAAAALMAQHRETVILLALAVHSKTVSQLIFVGSSRTTVIQYSFRQIEFATIAVRILIVIAVLAIIAFGPRVDLSLFLASLAHYLDGP